jgi:hypothetical protein
MISKLIRSLVVGFIVGFVVYIILIILNEGFSGFSVDAQFWGVAVGLLAGLYDFYFSEPKLLQ